MEVIFCYICYSTNVEEDHICDRCEEHYCYDCSCTYDIHTQYDSNLCYHCACHYRRKSLTRDMIRENKINILLYDSGLH